MDAAPTQGGRRKCCSEASLALGLSSPAQLWEDGWVTTQPFSQPTSLLTSPWDNPGHISEGTPLPLQKQTRAIFTAPVTTKARAAVSGLLQI